MTTALAPLLSQVAGLPGAPVGVEQIADPQLDPRIRVGSLTCFSTEGIGASAIGGSPPVLRFFISTLPGTYVAFTKAAFTDQVQLTFVQSVIGGTICGGNPAQQAVQACPAGGSRRPDRPAGLGAGALVSGPRARAKAAALGFAALSAVVRHAWLAAHLAALRAGHVTIAQLPRPPPNCARRPAQHQHPDSRRCARRSPARA